MSGRYPVIATPSRLRPSPIGRLIPGSPAEMCGNLFLYDELLIVNGHDVTQMDHGDIVQLIKGSDITIRLVVQQPESEWDHALPDHTPINVFYF